MKRAGASSCRFYLKVLFAIFVQSCTVVWTLAAAGQTGAKSDKVTWTELAPGDSKGDFALDKSLRLLYRGRAPQGVTIPNSAGGVWLSSVSPNGYILCIALQDRFSKAFLIDLASLSGYLVLDGAELHNGLSAAQWTSWSPDGKYALVDHYYEAHPELYVISIANRKAGSIPITLANHNEEQIYDLDSVRWDSLSRFHMRVTITCNAFTVDKCDDESRKHVLRSYIVTIDAPHLAITTTPAGLAKHSLQSH